MGKPEQLDKKAESTLPLPHEIDIKHCLNAQLIQLLREEESNGTKCQNQIDFYKEIVTQSIFIW
jgi:hypothetical protein